jgi:lipopolysaccharide biosynthesis glycosyltransferase
MNSVQMTRPIVLASDETYAMPLSTTLRSIVEINSSDYPLDFHVLSDGISEGTRKKVFESLPLGSATIRWVEVDLGPFREFSTITHVSKMTYARFLIPTIFPDTVSRVLYLDADILVLDDLGSLWETDLEGAVLGAVLDGLDLQIKQGKANLDGFEKMPCVRDYFNGGVILIDLQQWRKERISEKALEYLSRHPQSPYSDQDALNAVCDGLWKKLDPRWNFHDHHYKKKIADLGPDEIPGIVHFVTCLKPWKPSSISLNASFYDAFRSRTRFARTPLDKQWEVFQSLYYRLKRILRQYAFLRAIWSSVKGA